MARGHPPGRRLTPCLHCDMCDDYRATRAAQLEAAGGWRNETAGVEAVLFKQWLQAYQWPRDEAELLGVSA